MTMPTDDSPRPIDPSSSISTLIDRDRIRGALRMIPEGTDAASVTDEQISQVADDVRLFTSAHKIHTKDVARSIGYAPGVVSEFLNGKYKGNRAQVAIDLERWLTEEEERRKRPATTQFTWTNVALEIKATANYVLDVKKIGLIYGPDSSGIGKTTALQAIHQDMGPRRSTLVTINEVDGNPTGLLKKICAAMRIEDRGSSDQRFNRIRDKIQGRSHLLIIDQIQNLRWAKEDKPLYILADLYDATKTAQLWCGTADMMAYLERQQKRNSDESLAQIRRRIFPMVDLMDCVRGRGGRDGGGGDMLVTVEQVREMFARNKMKLTGSAARFLCEICNTPDSGGVGLCESIVEYANMLCEMKSLASIDTPLLQESLKRGMTTNRSELLKARMSNQPAVRAVRTA
jgi:DNA transposition AAA+ family ATPase